MKNAKLLAVAIATVASIPLMMAQQVNTQVNAQAQQSASAYAGGAQVNQSAGGGANANAGSGQTQAGGGAGGSLAASGGGSSAGASGSGGGYAEMRPVTGELENKLDAKTAKAGDPVVLKTREKMKTADGTVIPKGSRLVGHVTQVEAHEKGHAASQMGLAFDRAELKGGQTMAIHSMIESVQPSASAMSAASMADEGALGAPMGGAVGGGGMASGRVGGGGGLVGGAAGGVSSATGRVGSDLGATGGGALRSTGNVGGNLGGEATGGLGRGVNGAASGTGGLGTRATGIPGIMLNGDASGSASGMLTAANKNVHLDSGTQMVLGVTAAR